MLQQIYCANKAGKALISKIRISRFFKSVIFYDSFEEYGCPDRSFFVFSGIPDNSFSKNLDVQILHFKKYGYPDFHEYLILDSKAFIVKGVAMSVHVSLDTSRSGHPDFQLEKYGHPDFSA